MKQYDMRIVGHPCGYSCTAPDVRKAIQTFMNDPTVRIRPGVHTVEVRGHKRTYTAHKRLISVVDVKCNVTPVVDYHGPYIVSKGRIKFSRICDEPRWQPYEQELHDLLNNKGCLFLDLSETSNISGDWVRIIHRLLLKAKKSGFKVSVTGIRDTLWDVFKLRGVFPDMEDAVV